MNILYPKQKLHTTDLLLLGSAPKRNDLFLSRQDYDLDSDHITKMNNSFLAFQWLEKYAGHPNKLKSEKIAILCNLDFLIEENFLFLKNLRRHPVLKHIPFIVFSDKKVRMDKSKALKSGIDDLYQLPMEMARLQKRIDFLHRYKSEIQTDIGIKEAKSGYRIPVEKRIFDILLSLSLIIFLSPIFLLIALLIKLESKGPIVYRSKRVGTGYQVFDFLKFRSMVQHADAQLKALSHLNQYDKKETSKASFVKLKNDPRITKVGKFIRKTSLDELPQLFNVLAGDMSIVGNRPLPLYEAEKITTDEWADRFRAPAGITGLWQVSGKRKDVMTAEERIALDINYAIGFSFWMDIKILFKTVPAMIQKEE